jgi:hypothetical protein
VPNRCHAAFELGENEGEKSKKAAEGQSLCDGGRNRVRPWDPMIKRHLFLCFLANRYGTRRGVLTNLGLCVTTMSSLQPIFAWAQKQTWFDGLGV